MTDNVFMGTLNPTHSFVVRSCYCCGIQSEVLFEVRGHKKKYLSYHVFIYRIEGPPSMSINYA